MGVHDGGCLAAGAQESAGASNHCEIADGT